MRDTLGRWWTYSCVAFSLGAAAHKRRQRRRVRRRAGAW